MDLTALPQYRRHAKRFAEVVTILGRYGLAGWISEREPELVKKLFTSAHGEALAGRPRNERIRMVLVDLGTTYVKLGQILSTRPDLIGPDLASQLVKLQSDTPADPPAVVRATIEAELGRPLDEAFAAFDEEALASASIGQVHRGRLADGTEIVVKVQHEGVEARVVADLEILQGLADYAEEHHPALEQVQAGALAAEFSRTLLRELDYGRELKNTQRFAHNFADDPTLHFARVYPALSSRRVLTMEFIDGYSIAHTDRLEADRVDTHELAWRGANAYLQMIFRDGFYHADPHPGNVFVLEGSVLALLDCGMVGRVGPDLREDFEDLLIAVSGSDGSALVRSIVRIGKIPPSLDRDSLEAEVADFLETYSGASIESFDLSGALNDFTAIVRHHHIVLPAPISMLLKVLVMLEGTAQLLDPAFSLTDLIEPYYSKAIARKLDPGRMIGRMRAAYRDWDQLFRDLPVKGSQILTRLEDGSFDVHLQHRRLDAVANRAVLGLVTAALLIASAMLWSNEVPPLVWGVSLFGALGYAVALFFVWRLLRAIRASGDLRSRD